MTTHIILLDGTWNGNDDEQPTNIRRMQECYGLEGQKVAYWPGPGNEDENSWLMEKLGGAFGIGMWAIRDAAFTYLVEHHRAGDEIAIFGFSRGAAIARLLCAKLTVDVDFLGCFDTVFARLPITGWQQGTLFSDLTVAPNVKRAAHAVALDEDRAAFTPDLMNLQSHITEVWFPGGHSDVGGGNEHTGLSDGAFQWMLEEAAISYKDIGLKPDAFDVMTVSDAMLRHEPRRVGVKIRDDWTPIPPAYHESVMKRIKYDPVYRQKWGHIV